MDKYIKPPTSQIKEITKNFEKDNDLKHLEESLSAFAEKYKNHNSIGDTLINRGDEYYLSGNTRAGQIFMLTVDKYFDDVFDKTTLFLRCAEYYIEKGETEKGIQHLISLCEEIGNYEESIAFRELTDVWQKYKHLVEGKVKKSIFVYGESCDESDSVSPENCSMQISDILKLEDDRLLAELSTHLYELSADGENPKDLNRWEKTVFFADEFWQEINSDGIDGYLYYYGCNFADAYSAFKKLKAEKTVAILSSVQDKFPDKKIPKALVLLQDYLDENEPDFQNEEKDFYNTCQKEIKDKLLCFIYKNQNRFR